MHPENILKGKRTAAYGRSKSRDRQREISTKNHCALLPPARYQCRVQYQYIQFFWTCNISSLGFYPANANVGIPSTFVSRRNTPPVSGYCFNTASSNPLRADVR